MSRTEPLGVRVRPELKERLADMAKAEDRPLASLVERLLEAGLKAEGKPSQKKVKRNV